MVYMLGVVLSCVRLFETPQTVSCQAPLSTVSQARILEWTFLTEESNPSLLHCRQILLSSEPPGLAHHQIPTGLPFHINTPVCK